MKTILNTSCKTILICLLLSTKIFSQTGNPYWTLPPGYAASNSIASGTSSLPIQTAPGYTGVDAVGPHNMFTDINHNPLFFVANGIVFSPRGYLVDTLIETLSAYDNLGGCVNTRRPAKGWSEICVVPVPDSCSQYYIFSATDYGNCCNSTFISCYESGPNTYYSVAFKPCYAIIDVSKQDPNGPSGELGKIIVPSTGSGTTRKIVDLYSSTSTTSSESGNSCSPYAGDIHYACTKLLSGTYRLLFVKSVDELICYKITSTGITFLSNNDLSAFTGMTGTDSQVNTVLSELEVYDDSTNNKIRVASVMADFNNHGHTLVLAEFNRTTGAMITSPAPRQVVFGGTTDNTITGVEFSPDGNYIYVTKKGVTADPTTVLALSWSNTTTRYNYSTAADYSYSQMELAQDGSIYFIRENTSVTVAKITSPNAASSASITTGVVTLSSYSSQIPEFSNYTGNGTVPPTYYLPDQIDKEYYGTPQFSNSACCKVYSSYNSNYYNTSTNNYHNSYAQTWKPGSGNNPWNVGPGTPVYIENELKIAAGYTVTIQNMTIKFTPYATLVVEGANGATNSGQLILKKCTLDVDTRCENKMWPGVRVWGNSTTTPRSNTNQGYIFIDSLSVIQNARMGVELGYSSWDALYDASYVPAPSNGTSAGGGIIITTNSSFINNERDIVFCGYPTYSSGGTTNLFTTTFTTTATLIESGVSPRYHVGFYDYKPSVTTIQGCSFGAGTYALSDTGIYSISSQYSLSQFTTGSVWNKFNDFKFGIWSTNAGGSSTVGIKQCKFLNNYTGVYIGGIDNATIDTDTFKLWNCGTSCAFTKSIGTFLDNSTGYKMENSYFYTTPTRGGRTTYGLIISNSGGYVNCAYNNTFKDLTRGIQMQYINYIYQTATPHNAAGGLLPVCNTFSNIAGADMYVPAYNASANISLNTDYVYTCPTCSAGIHHDQGTGDNGPSGYPMTSGNLFSHTSGGYDVWIDSAAAAYNSNWWYCNSGCSANKNPARRKYATVSSFGADVNCATDPYTNGLRMSNPVLAALAAADIAKADYDSLKAVLNSATDSAQISQLSIRLGNTLNRRHRLIDQGIHLLLDDPNDSTMYYVDSLIWMKALELPSRSRLQAAVNIEDATKASQALNHVISEEGESDYTRLYNVLIQNFGKTPSEIMANPSNIALMQQIDQNKSDVHAYVKANILLQAVGLSHYEPIVQDSIGDAQVNQSRIARQDIEGQSMTTLVSNPNPFKDFTTIRTVVATKTDNAIVVITDALGKQVAKYKVNQGETEITFNGGEFNQQVFFCTLVVDGAKIKTNKLVVIK